VPEIRVSSLRGLMRYWLRAAIGSLADTEKVGLDEVRELEKRIFGATDQGSAVHIRVTNISGAQERFKKESYSEQDVSGRDYLYWSMARSGKGRKYKPDRWYFTPGTRFKITLSAHDQEKRELDCAVAAIWLLLSLGGIGSRSRRCAGSLTVTSVSGNTTSLSFAEVNNVQELQGRLKQGIQNVRQLYTSHLTEVRASMGNISHKHLDDAPFDILSLSSFCRIWILQGETGSPWLKLHDALHDIGKELQACRRNISSPEQRAVLGLPLIIRGLQDQKLKKALEDSRRASPLLLKIKKLQGEQFVGIAVLFKTHVLPIPGLPQPDYTLVEEWIEKSLAYTTALEVTL